MAKLRFVHAADLHLDSPFQGIRSQAPEHVAQTLHRATFAAFENIIDLCIRERVDALLVAGDVYDGADRSLRAQLKFVEGLARLDAAGIRSFICHGNHDPLDGWEARLDLPPGCVRFGPEVTGEPVFPNDPERAAVYGISYPRRDVRENLSTLFRGIASGGGYKVGLLHANVGGNPSHDSYSPCSVADLENSGIDYWGVGPRPHPAGAAGTWAGGRLSRQSPGPPPHRDRSARRIPGGGGRLRRNVDGVPRRGRGAVGNAFPGHCGVGNGAGVD